MLRACIDEQFLDHLAAQSVLRDHATNSAGHELDGVVLEQAGVAVGPKREPVFNADTMEKYRAEMRKYYFDPTKYKTYLEQLGITYPTIRSATSATPAR